MTTELQELQAAVAAWASDAFRWNERPVDVEAVRVALGLAEEVAELSEATGRLGRCVLKMSEGIRGTRAEWINEAEKEAGDVQIRLLALCELLGIDLSVATHERFAVVKVRPINHDPIGRAS